MRILRQIAGLLRAAWRAILRFLGLLHDPLPPPAQGWLGTLQRILVSIRLWPGSRQPQALLPLRPYDPIQRLHPVPDVALRLQKQAAGAFFEALEIEYLPGVLVEHLRQYDVSFALWTFCEEFRLRFHALATPEEPDHEEARDRLREVVGVLVDADQAARDTPLSQQPVVEALRRSPDEAETLLNRLRDAGIVWRDLHTRSLEWPRFAHFREVAKRTLADWAVLDEEVLEKISRLAADFEHMRTRFTAAEEEIQRLATDLLRAEDPAVRNLAGILRDRTGALINRVRAGSTEPAAGIDEIEDILADLLDLAHLNAQPAPDPTETLRHAFAVLGVEMSTSIKNQKKARKAYRELAMRYHPDRNQSPEATERMAELNTSYEILLRYFREGGRETGTGPS